MPTGKAKTVILILLIMLIGILLCVMLKTCFQKNTAENRLGFNLPVNNNERNEAETDCLNAMEIISDIYAAAEKENSVNAVVSDYTIDLMANRLRDLGKPITASGKYYSMENYEKMDSFLKSSKERKDGAAVVYEIHSDGGIARLKFNYDGRDMYVLGANAVWNEKNEPLITNISYNRIREWKYTEKGWFIYQYCVPEPPIVSEIINGYSMFRVKPLEKDFADISEKYLLPIGYQGNNLLCSDWNQNHMEDIDYEGLYEYLYYLKYGKVFAPDKAVMSVKGADFESLITEYLPITAEKLRKYAVYDEINNAYEWSRLDCGNYSPNFFGKSIPEVTAVEENDDGTVSLYIDAVCEQLGSDRVINHILTVSFTDSGEIRFLKNEISEEELQKLPSYQYRFRRE